MSETRRKSTREFRLEAVRLSEDPAGMAADVARALGISPKILYRWRQAFRAEGQEAFPGHGKLPESEEEMGETTLGRKPTYYQTLHGLPLKRTEQRAITREWTNDPPRITYPPSSRPK